MDNNKLNDLIGINLTYISDQGWEYSQLLQKIDGSFAFSGHSISDGVIENLTVEGQDGQWSVIAHGNTVIETAEGKKKSINLMDDQLFLVKNGDKKGSIFSTMEYYRDRIFHNYFISGSDTLTIGRSHQNSIQYENRYISSSHAVLEYRSGKWIIYDTDSTNGTFVNHIRISQRELRLGDFIDIYGLRMVVGKGFIAINDVNTRVHIRTSFLKPLDPNLTDSYISTEPEKTLSKVYNFNRSPGKKILTDSDPVVVEGPPMSLNNDEIPLMLRMGNSLVHGTSSVLSGNFLSAISTLVFPFMTRGFTEKQKKEYEEKRVRKYGEYLEKKKTEIDKKISEKENILNKNYPSISEVLKYSENGEHLWEMRNQDEDFLNIRLGTGKIKPESLIEYPERRFSLQEDVLEDKMYKLTEAPYYLKSVPIMNSFVKYYVTSITGDPDAGMDLVYQIVMQMVMLHSYDEVKTIFILSEDDLKKMSFIRFLPHSRNDDKNIRFIATTEKEAFNISEFLKTEIDDDLEKGRPLKKIMRMRPYYCIFALNRKLFEDMEIMKDIMESDVNVGVSVITCYNEIPKDCQKIIKTSKYNENVITNLLEPAEEDISFSLDSYDSRYAGSSIKRMSNYFLNIGKDNQLPKTLSFLDMYKVGMVEKLNILKRWEDNDPVKSLSAPIGVHPDGSLFTLDLHEKYQGPHGLVAGMTGSGKSEFILSYILSMAVNFRPEEVSFILIDYKGGGLAGAFDNSELGIHLPHVSGTITNLDGAEIGRSLLSIESELKRRQRIFNETKQKLGEGTMDIYAYQRLYRNHQVEECMPHLFIISDEFAELKAQEPDFMDQLISTARIGRSLGVHLILATQKPSGVVNDQIWSNTKFRVCLKVQDKSDSTDMLKRPEAAELQDVGRFYLQVGYNEYFAIGQSAWSGARYQPTYKHKNVEDEEISFIDHVGNTVYTARKHENNDKDAPSQIVEIIKHIDDISKRENVKQYKIWEKSLEKVILKKDIDKVYANRIENESVSSIIGLIDDPERQSQYPLILDFAKTQHLLVVGEAKSGKTEFLRTMLLSLARNYTPEDFQCYIMDFSGGLLGIFKDLPHCGVYITEESSDRIDITLKTLKNILEKRKKMFESSGTTDFESVRIKEGIPHVFLVIDNAKTFFSLKKGEDYTSYLLKVLREFASYGIHFVITCSQASDIYGRIRNEIKTRLTLQLPDKYDYGEILGTKCRYLPSCNPGRGMCVQNGRVLEYQVVYSVNNAGNPFDEYIKDEIENIMSENTSDVSAIRIPTLSKDEEYTDFCEGFEKGVIPLGYHIPNITKIGLPRIQMSALSLYFGNTNGKKPILQNFCYAFGKENMQFLIIKRKSDSIFSEDFFNSIGNLSEMASTKYYNCNPEDIKAFVDYIVGELYQRKRIREAFCQEQKLDLRGKEATKKVFNYMKENVVSLVIFFESFSDFAKEADDSVKKIMDAVFQISHALQIYRVACFEPDDAKNISSDVLLKNYNPDNLHMMFGGKLDRQGLINLPYKLSDITDTLQYNRCIMHYRNEFYTLQVPCGKISKTEKDEFSSIFEKEGSDENIG